MGTEVLDRQDRPLALLPAPGGVWRFRVGTAPTLLTNLLIAVEDRRFWYHPGVDPLALLRATAQMLRTGHVVSGGSTLAMQAARLLEPRPCTLRSKLIESPAPYSLKPATAGGAFSTSGSPWRRSAATWKECGRARSPGSACRRRRWNRRRPPCWSPSRAGRNACARTATRSRQPPCGIACWRSASVPACSMPGPRPYRPPACRCLATRPNSRHRCRERRWSEPPSTCRCRRRWSGLGTSDWKPCRSVSARDAGGRRARAKKPHPVFRRLARPGPFRRDRSDARFAVTRFGAEAVHLAMAFADGIAAPRPR